MIDQDYAELLGRSPPSGEVLEWTFPARSLANAFVALLVGTPALCLTLYMTGLAGDADYHSDGADLRIPTLTQLGIRSSPVGVVFGAGMQLAAVVAIPLFWCVKLSHHQRLQARTGVARYDQQAEGAIRWVTAAWVMGALGAALLFASASVPGDEDGASFSPQGVVHLVLTASAACGLIGQAACTAWALREARLVFVVSDADLVAYRRKLWLASLAVATALAALLSVLIVECFVDRAWEASAGIGSVSGSVSSLVGASGSWSDSSVLSGSEGEGMAAAAAAAAESAMRGEGGGMARWLGGGGGTSVSIRRHDCDTEWCYSRSLLGLWEWLLLLLEAGFCIALRHDLAPATGGVGVESFVL